MSLPAFDNLSLTQTAAYIGGAVAMGFGAIGAATGEGYTASQASEAMARDREHAGDIVKNMLVGQAISESASIFSLVIAILLLFMDIPDPGIVKAASLLAAGLCMGFGAIGSGVGAGVPAGRSCLAIARQPAISGRITTNMLIGTAVCRPRPSLPWWYPLILLFKPTAGVAAFPTGAALIGAGLSTGLAAIGSGYGGGLAAGAAVKGSPASRKPPRPSQRPCWWARPLPRRRPCSGF